MRVAGLRRLCLCIGFAVLFLLVCGSAGGPFRALAAEPLTLQCPPDTRVRCDRADDTEITGTAQTSGGCGGTSLVFTDSLPPMGGADTLLLRLWTAADSCGQTRSCVQRVALLPIRPRIAVLPLENLAESEEGSRVLARLLENAVLQSPQLELISPGTVESALLRGRIRQPFLLEDEQRRRLAEALDAHYLLVGSLLAYQTFEDPYSGPIPIVGCALQLLAPEGRTVWSETFHAVGSDGEWLFGLGVEHDTARMSKRLAAKAIRRMIPLVESVPCRLAPR